MALWTIIYEHCSYFSREPMVNLFTRCGFTVRSVQESLDGQFLGIEAVPAPAGGSEAPAVAYATGLVHQMSLLADRFDGKIMDWRQQLHSLLAGGKRVVGWGAGARAVSFLNTLGITDQVPYIVDINPRKSGYYMAGTAQRIVPPEFLVKYRPDVVIIMNNMYHHEVAGQVRMLGLDVEFLHA
jgi:hypothetical protein